MLPLEDARAGNSQEATAAINKKINFIEKLHAECVEKDPETSDLCLMTSSDNQETHDIYKAIEANRMALISSMRPIIRYLTRKDKRDNEGPNEVEQRARDEHKELEKKYDDITNRYPHLMGCLHGGFTSIRSFFGLHDDLCMKGIVYLVGYGVFYDKISNCASGWYKTSRMLIEKSARAWSYVVVNVLNAVLGRELTLAEITILLPHVRNISDTGIKSCSLIVVISAFDYYVRPITRVNLVNISKFPRTRQ